MNRRFRVLTPLLALAAVGLASACSEQPSAPQASGVEATLPPQNILLSCSVAQDSIDAMLPRLFTPGSQRGQSVSTDNQMNKALRKDNVPLARQYLRDLLKLTLDSYYANPSLITGGRSAESTRRVQDFISGLYCVNGITNGGQPIAITLDPNGGAAVITPETGAVVSAPDPTTPGKNDAATQLKIGDLPANVPLAIVSVRLASNQVNPLDTKLDQRGPFYEFDVTPRTSFARPVLVGVCLNKSPNANVDNRIRLAHNLDPALPIVPGNVRFGNIEIFTPVNDLAPLNLSCDPLNVSFLEKALDWMLPEKLYAGGAGTGGRGGLASNYSPFGGVDPQVTVSANSPVSQNGTAGQAVAAPPSVVLSTASGTTVQGVSVNFVPVPGSGTADGSPQTTAANGVATVTSWTISSTPGTNTLNATPTTTGLTFAPASVTFTATGTSPATPLVYGASGWKYGIYASEGAALAGIANNGATLPNTGSAPFWSPNAGCALNTAAVGLESSSSWPSGSPTFIAVQRDFSVPSGSTSVTIFLAVDNDARVFLDGNEITGSALRLIGSPLAFGVTPPGDGTFASGEYIIHEGCPSKWEYKVIATGLSGSVHSITAVARDRGTSTYFDASTEPPAP